MSRGTANPDGTTSRGRSGTASQTWPHGHQGVTQASESQPSQIPFRGLGWRSGKAGTPPRQRPYRSGGRDPDPPRCQACAYCPATIRRRTARRWGSSRACHSSRHSGLGGWSPIPCCLEQNPIGTSLTRCSSWKTARSMPDGARAAGGLRTLGSPESRPERGAGMPVPFHYHVSGGSS